MVILGPGVHGPDRSFHGPDRSFHGLGIFADVFFKLFRKRTCATCRIPQSFLSKTLVEMHFELDTCSGNRTAAVLVTNATRLIRLTDLTPPAFCSFIKTVLISPKLACFKM